MVVEVQRVALEEVPVDPRVDLQAVVAALQHVSVRTDRGRGRRLDTTESCSRCGCRRLHVPNQALLQQVAWHHHAINPLHLLR